MLNGMDNLAFSCIYIEIFIEETPCEQIFHLVYNNSEGSVLIFYISL